MQEEKLLALIFERGLSHPLWRFALLTRRYRRMSIKRAKLLGEYEAYKQSMSTRRERYIKRKSEELGVDASIINKELNSRCMAWKNDPEIIERAKKAAHSPEATNKRIATFKKWAANNKETISQNAKKAYSLEYLVEKMGEEAGKNEYEKRIREHLENSKKGGQKAKELYSGAARRKISPFCREYWIEKGLSEEEADALIKTKQKRNLEFFTNKYGAEEGEKRWLSNLNKRSNTRSKKSFAEKERINQKRRCNAHIGMYTIDNISRNKIESLYLYAFVLSEDTSKIKFGLTKHEELTKRHASVNIHEELIWCKIEADIAIKIEQSFVRVFNPKRIKLTGVVKTMEWCENTNQNREIMMEIKNEIESYHL